MTHLIEGVFKAIHRHRGNGVEDHNVDCRFTNIQLRKFSGATYPQIRYWTKLGLLPSYRNCNDSGCEHFYDLATAYRAMGIRMRLDNGWTLQAIRKAVDETGELPPMKKGTDNAVS